jgi:hypothetical protein
MIWRARFGDAASCRRYSSFDRAAGHTAGSMRLVDQTLWYSMTVL